MLEINCNVAMRRISLLIFCLVVLNINGQESFNHYAVKSIYSGKMARVNFKSNPTARVYRTRISKEYKQNGVNFAGHYSFAYWGCGSPCTGCAIVDVKTGEVYLGPDSGFGYDFVKESKLLIVNPKDTVSNSGQNLWDVVYQEEIWVWREKTKEFIKLK